MTVTVNIPQRVEQADVAAARYGGVTVDALATGVLVSHLPMAEPNQRPELVEANRIPVRRTGQPLDLRKPGVSL